MSWLTPSSTSAAGCCSSGSRCPSATGSQIPAFGGGAARRIWVVGAQKVVPDLVAALRRLETYSVPRENARARATYGSPTAANEVLIVNGEPFPGRSTVLLLRDAIGY